MRFLKFSLLLTLILLAEQNHKYDVLLEGKSVVQVNSKLVKVSDIAKITPISNLDLALAVGKVAVLESLRPGETVILKGQDVLEKLREKGYRLDAIGYVFPTELTVTRIPGSLGKEEIKQFLTTTVFRGRDVEVLDVQVSSVVLPNDPRILELVNFSENNQSLTATLLVGNEEETVSVDAQVNFREFKQLPVFVFSANKGQKITEDMLVLRRVSASSVLRDSLPLEECVGRVLSANVKAGEVCSLSKTMKELLLRKKEPVEVVYESGGLTVKMLGESLSDAGIGDIVMVKNLSSGRIVQGVLSKDKKVLIQ
jgi:flagella basal body P-ring formation protein FlgA